MFSVTTAQLTEAVMGVDPTKPKEREELMLTQQHHQK